MNIKMTALSIMIFSVVTACAAKWELREERSDIALQWPEQPNAAKVKYVKAIKGFSEEGGPKLLNSIIYGSEGADQSTFGVPVAVATGSDGRMAVADTGCRCVHLYIPSQKKYIRISEAPEPLKSPVSVIFDEALNLYVSDSALKKVFVFGSDGKFLHPLPSDEDLLKRPTGLAYNRREKLVYVVDTIRNKIYAFDAEGNIRLSFGEGGEDRARFSFPTHIFMSQEGSVYVTDALNFRIAFFDDKGLFLGSFGHHGDGSGDFAMPKGVAADKDGNIYVADSLFDNVQLFDHSGKFLLTLGRRGVDPGEFWMPSGIFIDDNGTLFVCDSYNRRVQLFRISENYVEK